ncbi:MAG: hypothetical protein EB078_00170 [Proteobacteria bacterium]|nr:hypothetical protein [Pseudomonadota bacterium]NDC23190.1 hypothetical protein [Pseudomonadota bacterium]NDD03295.1 hypothetical protein [Pseudomonadota bacterium]NDG26504.1 hypothetical protein [Pseudomonadota bacterium]
MNFASWANEPVDIGNPLFLKVLFNQYQSLHQQTLVRYFEVENKSDGLSEEFRNILGDRKLKVTTQFSEKGKVLPDINLLQAMITERKRLEADSIFIDELGKSPLLIKQFEKKICSNLLLLEASIVMLTYIEYLDEFNRGVRKLPKARRNIAHKNLDEDVRLMKVLSATLTAFDYSKMRKSQMALSNTGILAMNPKESKDILSIIESGLGKMNEDTLITIPDSLPNNEKKQLEDLRLKNTKKLVKMIDRLAKSFIVANKAQLDDYQYHILKLTQKLNEGSKETHRKSGK